MSWPILPPAVAAVLLLAGPAEAHRLKLFAHVVGDAVTGYGFYIGGGRPAGADIAVRDASGVEIGHIRTASDGSYSYAPPGPGTYTLDISGGDGHFAEAIVAFGASDGPTPTPAATMTTAMPAAAAPSLDDLDRRIAASVDRAVARQITPLLEAYDAAEGRVRFNDIVGGLGWIVGLFGLYMWFASRRAGGGKRGPHGG